MDSILMYLDATNAHIGGFRQKNLRQLEMPMRALRPSLNS